MNWRAAFATAVLLAGCAPGPTGVGEMRRLQSLEAATERGEVPWVSFYINAVTTIDSMQPSPWLAILRARYTEMTSYAQAFKDGKISAQEFLAIRDKSLSEYRPKFQAAYKTTPMLIGENERKATDAATWEAIGVLGGVLIGASLANQASPPPRPAINCISTQSGRNINTTCN